MNRQRDGQFALRLEAGASLLCSAGDSLQSVVSRLLTCFKTQALYMVCYYPAIVGADSGQADHARARAANGHFRLPQRVASPALALRILRLNRLYFSFLIYI